jgi:PhzF family phenazine biosynthesis protein
VRASLYQVVTFAEHVFQGNPAQVVVVEEKMHDLAITEVCKLIGADVLAIVENPSERQPKLSFFTAKGSHPGAGHAAHAAARIALDWPGTSRKAMTFELPDGGQRNVRRNEHGVAVDWPAMSYEIASSDTQIAAAIGMRPVECFVSAFGYIAILPSEAHIAHLSPDLSIVAGLDRNALIVTSAGEKSDIAIRVFAPRVGLPEDPVCGTAHRIIVPYWANQLGKSAVHSRQLSPRGGDLWCSQSGDQVTIAGPSITSFEGVLHLPD